MDRREDPERPRDDGDAAALPIDGVLDLHAFSPRDTRELVAEYLAACLERGLLTVRIIHGKGIGAQREIVHALLRSHPAVASFGHPHDAGGWGATVVELRPPAPRPPQARP